MRRAGFLAVLAAGVAFLGASLHGMTSVDRTLEIAAAPPASHPEFVTEPDCERWRDRHPQREV